MSIDDIDWIKVFAEDARYVQYRPDWTALTGSVLSSILLAKTVEFWDLMGKRPFYKFKEPFKPGKSIEEKERKPNPKHKPGDSWCEALGFKRSEFDRALREIGKKVKKGQSLPGDCFVWYWTDMERVTWYRLNVPFFDSKIKELYVKQESALRKAESCSTHVKQNPALDKNPSGSSRDNQQQRQGVVFDLPSSLSSLCQDDQKYVSSLLSKSSGEQKRIFSDVIFDGVEDGTIKCLPAFAKKLAKRAASGSLSESKSTVDTKSNFEFQKRYKEFKKQLGEGKQLMIDGQFVDVDLPAIYHPSCANFGQLIKSGTSYELR